MIMNALFQRLINKDTQLRTNEHTGATEAQVKCNLCKKCWMPARRTGDTWEVHGECIYGGPFENVLIEDKRPPWEDDTPFFHELKP